MATVATPQMTAAQFYEWVHRPENQHRHFELERGEVVEMPPPGTHHGFVCGNASRLLGNYAAQRRMGYVCTNDSGVVVATGPDTVRGPDIAFYSDVQSPDDIQWSYATQPPQLVVEVLSPNDKPGVLSKRIDQYLNCGVPLIWVIDPDIRIVTVYPRGAQQKVFEEADELTGNSVLPDFRCQVRELFSLPGR